MTSTWSLPAVEALATEFLMVFGPGLRKLARKAGWASDDLRQEAFAAAVVALANFDSSRGKIMPRAWFLARREAAKCGFLPQGAARVPVPDFPGGDDPADILEALETFGFLAELLVDTEVEAGPARSRRRKAAKKREAAERFLRRGRGPQGELFEEE